MNPSSRSPISLDQPDIFANAHIHWYRLPYVFSQIINALTLRSLRTFLTLLAAIILTTWHLGFATIMTQILARTTSLLDGRKTVKMTGRVYLRAIVPIGLMFSLSLICGNMTYLYLSVAFIQMLKVGFGSSDPSGNDQWFSDNVSRLLLPSRSSWLPGAWVWPR